MVLLLFFLIVDIKAQKYDYNWVFRSRWPDTMSLITFQGDEVSLTKPVVIDRRKMNSTNMSLSNVGGEFMLSSNGCELWDRKFELINNSRPLNPGEAFTDLCTGGFNAYEAGHQSMMALPDPSNPDYFLLFHEQQVYLFDSTGRRHIERGAILLTKVDITTDPPTVVFKNQDVIRDTMTYGGSLNAVKHDNLEAWWMVIPLREEACFYRFLIDRDGIHGPEKQCIGRQFNPDGEGGSQSCFSPDGSKFVRWYTRDGINIFDFDRTTGELSNFVDIPFTADSILFGGMSISSSSRFLYITTLLDLYQYDLEADDIEGSQVHIATFDGHRSPGSCTFANGQLAPDCKIYWSSAGACTELHVIHQPNEKGGACDFRQHDFKRVSNSNSTMPYFPNYRLGTGEVCDTNLMVSVRQVVMRQPELRVWPNPADDRIWVETTGIRNDVYLTLVNSMGQTVLHRRNPGFTRLELDLSGLTPGVYTLMVGEEGTVVSQERVVVAKR